MDMKKLAAEKAVEAIKDNMIVGLGTGSTAYWAIQKIGERVKEGLQIGAVATSRNTEEMARELGIPILPFADVESIDVTIDGADEVDQQRNLIKGGGGALLREKLIAFNSKQYFIIVDETKLVDQLGRFPLPVEILPFAMELTLRQLQKKCSKVEIRQKDGKPYVTDNGNLIADVHAYPITNPMQFNEELHQIPGVLETGLFPHTWVTSVIVGTKSGEIKVM
jgi:ribose 5-phosphate isomerase A